MSSITVKTSYGDVIVDAKSLPTMLADKKRYKVVLDYCKRPKHSKAFESIKKTATAAQQVIEKQESILRSFTKIAVAVADGKDVRNYSVVMFYGRAVVCRNRIEDLFLRFFGGRRYQVGEALPALLETVRYENRMQARRRLLDDDGFSKEAAERELMGMITDYNLMAKYGEFNEAQRGYHKRLSDSLIIRYFDKSDMDMFSIPTYLLDAINEYRGATEDWSAL